MDSPHVKLLNKVVKVEPEDETELMMCLSVHIYCECRASSSISYHGIETLTDAEVVWE